MKKLFSFVRNLLPGKPSRPASAAPSVQAEIPLASASATCVAEVSPGPDGSSADPALVNYLEQPEAVPVPEPRLSPSSRDRGLVAPVPRARPNLISSARQGVGTPAPRVYASPAGASSRPAWAPTARQSTEPPVALATEPSPGRSIPARSPIAMAPGEPASQPEPLLVNLVLLAESWPEEMQAEIQRLNLWQAQVALPKELVAAGLKEGRLAFSWEALCSWMRPPLAAAVSSLGATELELPLKAVAPLFLAKQRELQKPRQKIQVDEEIPDVFGVTRPAPAPAAPPANVAPPANGAAAEAPAAVRLKPEPPPASTRPQAGSSSTPDQLVSRAVQLKGVAGALVTLRDGWLVASRFPAQPDANKVAAFLPRIFTRFGDYTRELELGELNTLEFLVDNVPWKAFRLNEVLFVVFGHPGEVLPHPELGCLAAEFAKR